MASTPQPSRPAVRQCASPAMYGSLRTAKQERGGRHWSLVGIESARAQFRRGPLLHNVPPFGNVLLSDKYGLTAGTRPQPQPQSHFPQLPCFVFKRCCTFLEASHCFDPQLCAGVQACSCAVPHSRPSAPFPNSGVRVSHSRMEKQRHVSAGGCCCL